ncbi:MAG: flagellar basal-body rod protein FlgF [Oligoflexia bacterium]|nr:flagellar basal-body rod protein FlgF [Oligoflexia bacterium]
MSELWVPLSGAIAQQQNIETIANNVANANTPGFKKDQLVFKEYLTILNKDQETPDLPRGEWKPGDFYRSQGAEHGYVKTDGTYTLFNQGELKQTGNPLDLAIFGQGFFEILTPNGIRFSRKGIFSISKDGELVTEQGYKVLSKIQNEESTENKSTEAPDIKNNNDNNEKNNINDRAIKIAATANKITVTMQGEIYANNAKVGDLSLVEFKDIHALKKEGDSLYINIPNENIVRDDLKTAIHQGFVEGSNVEAVTEMSNLIKAHRHFESIQRAIKTYDSISQRSVNDIAKF